jgi:hypothetical protein
MELLYEHQPRGTEPPQSGCQLPSNVGTKNSYTKNNATLISPLGDTECPHHRAGVQKHLTSGCLGKVRHSRYPFFSYIASVLCITPGIHHTGMSEPVFWCVTHSICNLSWLNENELELRISTSVFSRGFQNVRCFKLTYTFFYGVLILPAEQFECQMTLTWAV